jgi:hypothetical protein
VPHPPCTMSAGAVRPVWETHGVVIMRERR